MAQTIPFDAFLGASKSGQAIGCTIYQLDGTTVHSAFATAGWYEAPVGSGAYHHAGLNLPDAGGVVAVGIGGTEYQRLALGANPAAAVWSAAERTLTAFGANALIEFTYTLTDSVTTLPLSGAIVRISTDSGGNNTVWGGVTDVFGVARDAFGSKPRLAAGTYYIRRSLSGYVFSDPDIEVVSA